MISAAVSLFLMRDLPLSAFDVPRRQVVGVMALLGLLMGMGLAGLKQDGGPPLLPLPLALALGMVLNALLYALMHGMLRRWLMRNGRWDGKGSLFNLLLAAGLVPNVLSALLDSLHLPSEIGEPVALLLVVYGVWVVTRAIVSTIPGATLRSSLIAVALSSVFAFLVLLTVATLATPLWVPYIDNEGQQPGQALPAGHASGSGTAEGGQPGNCPPAGNYRQRPGGAMQHERFDRQGDPLRAPAASCGGRTGSQRGDGRSAP
ncbi:MAG: hypothetical protein Q4B13_04240 [Lautropia sp.]|nr:hypothetical protein [Lautropia sp.]